MWRGKMSECLKEATLGTWGVEVDDRIAMQEGDIFFYKKWPSAFNGTPLQSFLTAAEIDTLIITGCTTSGCVRGTIYDSFSAGFRTIVPYECVADIKKPAHEQNLADVQKRYADVLPLTEVLEYIHNL
jgi:maleamate amidohydrolase